ncbi:Delta(24(24(1)))-sterol reductase [Diplonema papillatum]|nr:Delta(24(24(1)))-sterol reductase [Diplonema papillatum]|eukprot:gene18144-27946_t
MGANLRHKEEPHTLVAILIMLWSHFQLYYMWYAAEKHQGHLWMPAGQELDNFATTFIERCSPTPRVVLCYGVYFIGQLLLAQFVPGFEMEGVPIEKLKGKRLPYLCNGYQCFYIALFSVLGCHAAGIWTLDELVTDFGRYLTVAVIWGNLTAVFWYLYGVATGGLGHNSGSPLYDMFMGRVLFPRIGRVDIKMVAEVRWSWLTLLLLTLSRAHEQYHEYGHVSNEMYFMLFAHWLYANACAKGEHFIVSTYDMHTEAYGWMLNFWNIAGVPFVYCFSSVYLSLRPPMDNAITWVYFALYCGVYWFWDVANYQKNDLRLSRLGDDRARNRKLFPQMPGSNLANPKMLQTPQGALLIDGLQLYGRKIHYTMDILKAFFWGAVTGFTGFLPFFYFVFFVGMIVHRYSRDDDRCSKKYGKHWEEYKRIIPYVFIPYVY